MIVNGGTENERAVRVVLESENHGREYFDRGSLELCVGCLIQIVQEVINSADDGVERVVGIAIIPRCEYGVESGYYPEFEDEENGCKAHFVDDPITEGVAAMEVLAQMDIIGPEPLSIREVKQLFLHRADETQGYDPAIQRCCKVILEVLAGKKGEKTFDNALQRLLGAGATKMKGKRD